MSSVTIPAPPLSRSEVSCLFILAREQAYLIDVALIRELQGSAAIGSWPRSRRTRSSLGAGVGRGPWLRRTVPWVQPPIKAATRVVDRQLTRQRSFAFSRNCAVQSTNPPSPRSTSAPSTSAAISIAAGE